MHTNRSLKCYPAYKYKFFFILFLLSIVFIFPGCAKNEKPKKVSLSKRSGEILKRQDRLKPSTIWFGFDLRLGPKEEVMIYTPFLKYLEKSTDMRFRIKLAERYEDTVENLGKGMTHFAAIGTLSYVIGKEKHGIKYLVSGVNTEGDPMYHAMIITKPESNIREIKDLKGRSFAFGSRISTQGHLIPRKMLEDAGIRLDDLSRYVYTGSHTDAVKAVLNRECDAAGIQDTLAERLASEGKVKIIKMSRPYPSSLIAYNSTVDSDTVEAVRSALLAFEPSGKHKNMLFEWDKTEMPLGFTVLKEFEFEKVRKLAEEYGIMQK